MDLYEKISILGPSAVLGEKDEQIQMRFYDEERILGAQDQVSEEIKKQQEFSVVSLFLNVLEKFNRFVLELWAKPFEFLRKIIVR